MREVVTSDGRTLRIGDKVPLPKRKLVIKPIGFVDDSARGPRGVFRNGRS